MHLPANKRPFLGSCSPPTSCAHAVSLAPLSGLRGGTEQFHDDFHESAVGFVQYQMPRKLFVLSVSKQSVGDGEHLLLGRIDFRRPCGWNVIAARDRSLLPPDPPVNHVVSPHLIFNCVGCLSTRGRQPLDQEPPPACPKHLNPAADKETPGSVASM